MDERQRHKQDLLDAHRKRLQVLNLQAARYGIDTKPEIVVEIDELKPKIQNLEQELLDFGRLERLRFLSSEILAYARKALKENQDILNDYFQDKENKEKYHQRMFRLYSDQQNHGNYESWIASLSVVLERENDSPIKKIVEQLRFAVDGLREAFYAQTPIEKADFKLNVVRVLDPQTNYSDEEINYTIEIYLNRLRELTGIVGQVHGALQEMTQ